MSLLNWTTRSLCFQLPLLSSFSSPFCSKSPPHTCPPRSIAHHSNRFCLNLASNNNNNNSIEELNLTNPLESGYSSSSSLEPTESLDPLTDDDLLPIVLTSVKAADDRKAKDIVALRVTPLTIVTCFFVFMSATSSPQLRAIVNNVQSEVMKQHKLKVKRISGNAESGWMLLDYGDIMVHCFDSNQRQFYDLDSRWAAGEKVDLSGILVDQKGTQDESRRKNAHFDDDDDIFIEKSALDEDWI